MSSYILISELWYDKDGNLRHTTNIDFCLANSPHQNAIQATNNKIRSRRIVKNN